MESSSGSQLSRVLQEELAQRYFDTNLLPILRQADANFVYEVTHEPDTVQGSRSIGEVGLVPPMVISAHCCAPQLPA